MKPWKDSRKPLVLVVDDESALRSVLALVLPRWGVEVLEAGCGDEAVELYRQHGDEIVLVLMDVNMPGPSGPETLEALQQIKPEVRCCFMTGNLGSFTGEELLRRGAESVIDKPFDLGALARLLMPRPRAA